jgi:hypothetical protein
MTVEADIAAVADAGDNTPSDVRTALTSVLDAIPESVQYLRRRLSDETPHALDDFFDSDTLADYTQTTPAGTATPTIGREVLSWVFEDQVAGDMVGLTKAFGAISPPITIETAVRLFGSNAAKQVGLCFSNGTALSSSYLATLVNASASSGQFTAYSGTFETVATDHGPYQTAPYTNALGVLFLRCIWKTTNTFKMQMSIDTVTWTDFGEGDMTFAMTPTRIGLVVSSYGSTIPSLATFEYFRVDEADRSA